MENQEGALSLTHGSQGGEQENQGGKTSVVWVIDLVCQGILERIQQQSNAQYSGSSKVPNETEGTL